MSAATGRHERREGIAEPGYERNGSSVGLPVKDNSEPPSAPLAAGDIARWRPIAESIVREGVTSKPPHLVATILAHREAGIPPSTIGRTYKVHHTTVGRILSAAEALSA